MVEGDDREGCPQFSFITHVFLYCFGLLLLFLFLRFWICFFTRTVARLFLLAQDTHLMPFMKKAVLFTFRSSVSPPLASRCLNVTSLWRV